MPKKRTERLSLSIDSALKRQFDAICAIKGLSMSEINESLIRDWVKENAPTGFFDMFQDAQQQTKKSSKSPETLEDATLASLISEWNLDDLAKKSRIPVSRLQQITQGEKPTEQEIIYLGRHLRRPDGNLYQTEGLLAIYNRDFPNNHDSEEKPITNGT